MVSAKILLFAVLLGGVPWRAQSAAVPFLEVRPSGDNAVAATAAAAVYEAAPPLQESPATGMRVRVAEGAPALLCAGLCNAAARPPAAISRGPVCAFNAVGTARTFATLCELETASCHDSTFYAIASIGEC